MLDPIVFLETPAQPQSAQPKLVKSTPGQIFLSWIQRNADGSPTLQLARFIPRQWTPLKEVTSDSDWFINWADFPMIAIHDTNSIAASYLEKDGQGKYAYDIRIKTDWKF